MALSLQRRLSNVFGLDSLSETELERRLVELIAFQKDITDAFDGAPIVKYQEVLKKLAYYKEHAMTRKKLAERFAAHDALKQVNIPEGSDLQRQLDDIRFAGCIEEGK
jgi:hypothetical protein